MIKLLNNSYNALNDKVNKIIIIDFETDTEFISVIKKLKKIIPKDLFLKKSVMLSTKAPERGVDKHYICFKTDKIPQLILNKLGLKGV